MKTAFDRADPPSHERALQSLLLAATHADAPDARLFGALVAARACRNELALLGLSHAQLAGLLARQFPRLPSADAAARPCTCSACSGRSPVTARDRRSIRHMSRVRRICRPRRSKCSCARSFGMCSDWRSEQRVSRDAAATIRQEPDCGRYHVAYRSQTPPNV
ncbi:hypothetical protein [Burkholderia pyrrocinia]|uniref:hypothetical protein n=1 Tax=Burkholderia pyrrocinia TaxID=60550 RepID=UPI0020C5CC4F|nr:hypothetical protein [Burkholderia pyrrocinia]